MITIIVAAARDGAIGSKGDLLWHLGGDLKRFKAITSGHTVVMGRKTWESLPKRPLPERINIVITSDKDYKAPGAVIAHSLEEGVRMAEEMEKPGGEIFIIGGASVYKSALPFTDKIDFTLVDAEFPEADAWFEIPDRERWSPAEESEWVHDEKSGLDYKHIILTRNACGDHK